MITKLFLTTLFILSLATMAMATPARENFTIPTAPPTDLVNETNTLKLDKEKAVQEANPPSRFFVSFLGGVTAATNLNATSYGHTVNYSFGQELPLANIQFTHYVFEKYGKWGWAASLGYSYSTYDKNAAPTALHIIPVNASLIYRGEFSQKQKFMPYLMAGPSEWIYFQRGLDEYNTSQAFLIGTATAGVAVNLNRLGWLRSRTDTEILFQYQRNISSNDPDANINGNTFEVGASIAL
jgi:hypothetical protein